MSPRPDLVVTLDGRVHAAADATVPADDPLFTRGDGVFETLLLRFGVPGLLEAHLSRLAESAAIVGLPPPDAAGWRRAVGIAAGRWGTADEGVLRMVHGRGTAFVTVSPVPGRVVTARRDGLAVVTLTRRVSDGPWSPVRAKSSSYAANVAALRHAAQLGADDAVFLDVDGNVLEGPRSAVVIEAGGELLTPPASLPILAGTTVAALFHIARRRGVTCREAMLNTADLTAAQSVWLLSAVTLAARVHTLDGVVLGSSATVHVAELVDAAVADPSTP